MRKGDFEDYQSRMQSLARSENTDENTEESDDEKGDDEQHDEMYCGVCNRYIGRMQKIWSYDPTICTEACSERRAQRNRD